MTEIERLDGLAFARTFALGSSRFAWLLGAGTSAAGNVPTAYDLITEFKAKLFCEAHRIARREVDPSDPLWRARIESYFDNAHGFPPAGAPDEYSTAFEAVYPERADRQRLIELLLGRARPSFGHRVVASLITSGRTKCIFTTNFDPLIERATVITDSLASTSGRHLTVAALDTSERAERVFADGSWPVLVKLHGDYQSVRLKNTSAELRSQDETLRRLLADACDRFGLVVCGYSGRDDSVMDVLWEAAKRGAFPSGLYWCARAGADLLPRVSHVMSAAAAAGRRTAIVEIENFDEFASDLESELDFEGSLTTHINEVRASARVTDVALPQKPHAPFPALRCSVLPLLSLPPSMRRIKLAKAATTRELQAALRDVKARGLAVARGRVALAFGRDDDLLEGLAAFGAELDGTEPVADIDSTVLGLLYDGLVRALSARRPLIPRLTRRGHDLVVRRSKPDDRFAAKDAAILRPLAAELGGLTGTVPKVDLPFAEAVAIRIEQHDGRWWCVFDPWTSIDLPRREDGVSVDEGRSEAANEWRRQRWATKYNPAWNRIIDAWSRVLAPDAETTVSAYGVHPEDGIDATFVVRGVTAWSRTAGPYLSSAQP